MSHLACIGTEVQACLSFSVSAITCHSFPLVCSLNHPFFLSSPLCTSGAGDGHEAAFCHPQSLHHGASYGSSGQLGFFAAISQRGQTASVSEVIGCSGWEGTVTRQCKIFEGCNQRCIVVQNACTHYTQACVCALRNLLRLYVLTSSRSESTYSQLSTGASEGGEGYNNTRPALVLMPLDEAERSLTLQVALKCCDIGVSLFAGCA